MADSENQQPVDTTQQVTSSTPTTRPKNPKRVAAGKAIPEKTKRAAEKRAAEKSISRGSADYCKSELQKKADPPVAAPVAAQVPDLTVESTRNVLTTTQWLRVISIIVS